MVACSFGNSMWWRTKTTRRNSCHYFFRLHRVNNIFSHLHVCIHVCIHPYNLMCVKFHIRTSVCVITNEGKRLQLQYCTYKIYSKNNYEFLSKVLTHSPGHVCVSSAPVYWCVLIWIFFVNNFLKYISYCSMCNMWYVWYVK